MAGKKGMNAAGESYKVLLIDDSIFVRKQLTQILSSEGFQIVGEADNGVDGFSKYKEIYPNGACSPWTLRRVWLILEEACQRTSERISRIYPG